MTPAGGCGGSFKCTDLFDRNNAPLTSPAGTTINESQFFKPPPCKVVFFSQKSRFLHRQAEPDAFLARV